jgi:hypothetical protein
MTMRWKLVKGLGMALSFSVLATLAGDRAVLHASTVPTICLDCSPPNCSCKPEPWQICDGSDKICRCNGEEINEPDVIGID